MAEEAIGTFEKFGDDLGLARAWRLRSTTPWSKGRLAEATDNLTRSLEHAIRSGDARRGSMSFQWMYMSRYSGPTTVEMSRPLYREFASRADRDRCGFAGLLHIQGAFEILGESSSMAVICTRAAWRSTASSDSAITRPSER